jgi:DNA ligase-1
VGDDAFMPGAPTLAALAVTGDAIAATSSKLAKVRLLADHLLGLEPQSLLLATRYFAGRVFAPGDPRTLNVGGAALTKALRAVAGVDDAGMRAAYRRHGDAGDAAAEILRSRPQAPREGMDLASVDEAFSAIATAPTPKAREAALVDLLRRCSPDEGRYAVKLITGDMRIGLREGLVEEAIGIAFERPAVEVARAVMLLGDLGEVACLVARGEAVDRPRYFSPLRFMLASPVADAQEAVRRMGDEVWVEDKYDGIRCQLHHNGARVALYSRDLNEVTDQFPEVGEAAAAHSADVILDGEILAFARGRVLPFHDLQTRLGRRNPSPAAREAVPVIYVAWDLLMHGDEALLDTPLRERRRRLEALSLGEGFALAHLEPAVGAAAVDERFAAARERRNEGLMLKDPDSAYTPGRRGLAWLKLKRPLDTLDVVVVGAEWGHGKRRGALSDVTFAVRKDDSELVTVGKAYTGLTDAEIAEMTALLLDITLEDRGHYRTVRPQIVLEVAFDAVQRSSRHRSGYALRFPRIAVWRHDKPVEEIDTLERVAAIAQSQAHDREQLVDPAG